MGKSNSELKNKYKVEFEKVRKLTNEFDPCGFIKSGAPIDEYESLINILLSSHYNNKSKEEIKIKLIDELENYYGMEKPENEKGINEFYNGIESLITKSELEIKNKPSH